MSTQLRLSAYSALATILTATALRSVFEGTAWVVPVMGAIVLVAASCAIVRSSALPSAFEPISATVAVLLWVTALYARPVAHVGFVPGRRGIRRLGHVARTGFTEIHRLPTPAPAHHGIVMLAVIGVAAIALVVDLMVVTLRRAALSGLPLLALFTVCAATGHHGVGAIPFIAGAIGYLFLLYADNREKVTRWGSAVGTGSRARPAAAWSTDVTPAPAPASLGRRVGAMTVSLAVVVPLFIPGLHTGIDRHGTGGSGSGGGSVHTFNPIVSVASDLTHSADTPVMTYRTSSADPGYLRLTSLNQFTGTIFDSPPLEAPASATVSEKLPVISPPGPVTTTTITIPSLALNWLPVQTTVLGVSVGDDWRYDQGTNTIFSATTTTEGLTYTARSVVSTPSPSELATSGTDDASVTADLALPKAISPKVKALTRRVVAKAHGNHYQEAVDLQNFFTKGHGFVYNTNIAADAGADPLADFLLKSRSGFCQQYATAMAVMARLAGIPSRVAVGFTRGQQRSDGTWVVTTHDAHAWPELWFEGYGWLAFEPTPRADGQAVTPAYARPATGTSTTTTSKPGGPHRKSGITIAQHPIIAIPHGATAGGSLSTVAGHHRHGVRRSLLVLLLAIIAVGLVEPGLARLLVRRRRWHALSDPGRAPAAAWSELRDTAIDLHAPWNDAQTPRQIAVALRGTAGGGVEIATALDRLARGEERSRYALGAPFATEHLRADLGAVRSALAENLPRRHQLMSRLMPRSSVRASRAMLGRVLNPLDLLDLLDRLVGRTVRALRGAGSRPVTPRG